MALQRSDHIGVVVTSRSSRGRRNAFGCELRNTPTVDVQPFLFLLFCLLPSASFTTDLQDLVSASNDFEVEMIEHEQVLERSPSATELAAGTFKYANAKERYFVEL